MMIDGMTPVERFWSKIDKTETCWLWMPPKTPAGYGYIRINGTRFMAHRFSFMLTRGPIPDGMEIDHVCHVRNCVRPDHLRVVSRKQNIENRAGLQRANTSGATGVHWFRGKWVAAVRHNKQAYYLGRFADFDEARAAVIAKRNELFTHNDIDRAA